MRYLQDHDAIEILTTQSGGFVVPRKPVAALQDVKHRDLAAMEIWLDGSVIEIDDLDIHISIDGLIRSALPVLIPSRIVAGLFAAQGGATTSAAKATNSRANGKKAAAPKRLPLERGDCNAIGCCIS